ncbi:MAG: acyl-CoA thioesterase [Sphingomonadales bacterium]
METVNREPVLRVVPQPTDINFNGNIFGGWILSQMDIAGGLVASRRAGGPVATVAIEAMEFHQPIRVGDWLGVYCDIEKVGRTSIAVKIECLVRRGTEDDELKVTDGRFVFVALGDDGKPRPVDGA